MQWAWQSGAAARAGVDARDPSGLGISGTDTGLAEVRAVVVAAPERPVIPGGI